jgi:predicted RNA binding protein YcfA (HicA-like mRNA interferase family)/predicted RNase H-like HicB family nuclease
MPPLPLITGREVVRALGRLGWVVVVQKGSHAQLKRPDGGGRVTVPLHAGETLGPGLLRSILNQAVSPPMNSAPCCARMNVMSTYTIVVEPEEDGGFFVVAPALPGCFTRGRTIEECRERAVEAIEVHIAGLRADGEPVPEEAGPPQLLAVTVAA